MLDKSLIHPASCGFSEHLAGPWVAVLTDHLGYVYPSVAAAREALGPGADVVVGVVRGTALPVPVDGGGAVGRVPEDLADGDLAYELNCRLVDDAEMPPAGPSARLLQARAMADGLNIAGMPVYTLTVTGGVL